MRRGVAGLMLGAFLAIAGATAPSARAGDAPPPLTPPVVLGPVADPSEAQPLPIQPPKVPENRPILVVPGINTPRLARPIRQSIPIPVPRSSRSSAAATGAARTQPPPRTRTTPPTIHLETIPDEPGQRERTGSSAARDPRPSTAKPIEPMPRRAPGFLGRMIPPVAPYRGGSDLRDAVTVEPRTDPAADAALKRRIERQIQESLGGRLRSAEVRVIGRQVLIRARPARFWQRRAVRSGLEAMPGLNGYKVDIQLVD